MKAVVIDKITEASDIKITKVEIPTVKPGWVLVKVKGFGLNHSEQILRLDEINADYIYVSNLRGPGGLIIGDDGSYLFCQSTYDYDYWNDYSEQTQA